MTDDLTHLRDEAKASLNHYFDELDLFYNKHIPDACHYATQNVTDARLKQVEADIGEINKRLNSSPSLGVFLLDLAISFIPAVGGNLIEYGLKSGFGFKQIYRDVVIGQRKFELFKAEQILQSVPDKLRRLKVLRSKTASIPLELDLETSNALFKKYKEEYEQLFIWAGRQEARVIQSKADLEEALRSEMTGGVSDPFFEFSTSVANDYFIIVGEKLLKLTDSKNLSVFANPSEPQKFSEYYQFALSRFADSPNNLVTFIVKDICRQQLSTNTHNRQLGLFALEVCASKEFFEQQKEAYTQMSIRLPNMIKLKNFELVMSEMLEASIWMMFLGDPKSWASANDPSGKYSSVPREGYIYGDYTPAYFNLKHSLPAEIEEHLLITFHPDLASAAKKNFRDYYKEKKTQNVPNITGYPNVGIEEPRGYRWAVPDQPDAPVESVATTSYTADETAFANLQIHFSKMYALMKSAEPFFEKITSDHLLT